MTGKDDKKQKLGHVILNDSEGSSKEEKKSFQGAQDDTVGALQQQVAELTEALQRERADVTNIRRRHEEQMASLRTTLKSHVVKDLLPVIDNFERALKHVPACHTELVSASQTENDEILKQVQDDIKKYDEYIKGVAGVVKQFEKTLAGMGVERIATVGEPFDPRYHEAVSMEEGDGKQEVVTEELQSGYKIGDDVIRHAMVRVKG